MVRAMVGITLVDILQNRLNRFHFLLLDRGLLNTLIDCIIFLSTFRDDTVSSFFACTARLWNSLPIECFPLNYDFSGLKSRIDRHLLTVGSF